MKSEATGHLRFADEMETAQALKEISDGGLEAFKSKKASFDSQVTAVPKLKCNWCSTMSTNSGVGENIAGKFQWDKLRAFPLGTESQRWQVILLWKSATA